MLQFESTTAETAPETNIAGNAFSTQKMVHASLLLLMSVIFTGMLTRMGLSHLYSDPKSELVASDPYDLANRFCTKQHEFFDVALSEIKAGQKKSHWSWWIFPVAPFVVNGVEKGSATNRAYALRDLPPNDLRGDDAAYEFLRFHCESVDLRSNYIAMMSAVADQLEAGIPPIDLVGELDDPKLRSSLRLFERISRGNDAEVNEVCQRVLAAMLENIDS